MKRLKIDTLRERWKHRLDQLSRKVIKDYWTIQKLIIWTNHCYGRMELASVFVPMNLNQLIFFFKIELCLIQ